MTRLAGAGRAIIEVGLNETAAKSGNPHVPYGPDEVAAAAIACGGAGAGIVHFHARHDDGTQAWTDAGVYRAAMESIASEADILCYPTYPPRVPRDERYAHLWSLADDPTTAPLELAPIDIGSRNVSLWDEESRRFETLDMLPANHQVALNPPDELEWVMAEAAARGLHPSLGIFDMTYLRYSVHCLWAGLLRPPLLLKLFLSDRWVGGTFATPAGIDAYLSQIPEDVDAEVIVVPYAMATADACEALWRHALARGCGIRVGIGDNPRLFEGDDNAAMVERAAKLLASHDLTPATPSDVRTRLGLQRRA